MSAEIEVGQLVDSRFRVTDLICRSGTASIFKAIDTTNGQFIALKIPFLQYEADVTFYNRFKREEEIGKKLNHPNIVKFIPLDAKKNCLYIAMEYLEGQMLSNVLENDNPLA